MSTEARRSEWDKLSGGDPLFGNKIAAGILVPLLFVVALNVFSGIIYTPGKPKIAGYDLPQPEPAAEGAGGEEAKVEPIAVRLASADPGRGQAAAKKCLACHIFDKGGPNKIGPNLYGVVARPKGSHEGFAYSGAMKGKGGEWSYDDLDHFLTNPKGYVAGTIMAFAGVANPKERADIIDYLHTLSDNPVAFPKPEPAAPAGDAPPAEGTKTQPASGAAQPVAPQSAAPQPADPATQTQPSTPNQPQPPAAGNAPGGQPTGAGEPASTPAEKPAAAQPASPPGSSTPAHQ